MLILAACTSSRIDCHDPSPIVATPAPPATPAQTVGASTGGTKRADKASSIEEAAPLNDLAKVELYAGRFEAASRLYEQSLSIRPTPIVEFSLATAYYQQGMFDKAISC